MAQGAIRFHPARSYFTLAAVALGLGAFSGWWARSWLPAVIPAILFVATSGLILWLALRPVIEVSEEGIQVGGRMIFWRDIRRVDQTGWISPMVADLTLSDKTRLRLIYPGETQNSNRLLRIIQQYSTCALINGVPHHRIFQDSPPAPPVEQVVPRVRLLREEDEAEVERLYHKLRTAGRLDPEK